MSTANTSIEAAVAFDPMDRRMIAPFVGASLAWAAIGAGICFLSAGDRGVAYSIGWMGLFWALSLFDLFALSRALGAMVRLAAGSAENRVSLIIQASYWGALKLACLGIFGAILLKGHSIPSAGVLTGLGTLVFVPLAGGYGWSRKVLSHA